MAEQVRAPNSSSCDSVQQSVGSRVVTLVSLSKTLNYMYMLLSTQGYMYMGTDGSCD